jgi:hypothetical protein
MSDQPLLLDDLGYELQLLLGADEVVSFRETHDNAAASDAERFGNLVNYFKDSIYLDARNLLNAFTEHADTEIELLSVARLHYHEEPGAVHVYPLLPVPEGRAARTQLMEYIGSILR